MASNEGSPLLLLDAQSYKFWRDEGINNGFPWPIAPFLLCGYDPPKSKGGYQEPLRLYLIRNRLWAYLREHHPELIETIPAEKTREIIRRKAGYAARRWDDRGSSFSIKHVNTPAKTKYIPIPFDVLKEAAESLGIESDLFRTTDSNPPALFSGISTLKKQEAVYRQWLDTVKNA